MANTTERYGLVAITLHWLMAVMVIGLFLLGLYMRNIDYVHPWYRLAPHLHESFGLMVFALLLFRTFWRFFNVRPAFDPMPEWESRAALAAHRLFYLLLFGVVICGYLIPTADGRGIDFLGLFEVPALVTGIERQEDLAGELHLYLAVLTMALTVLHSLAALKHHFIDRDGTLVRMIGIDPEKNRK